MEWFCGTAPPRAGRHCEPTGRNDVDGLAPHSTVIPAHAGIQYAATFRFYHWGLWDTGSPAFAGDDN